MVRRHIVQVDQRVERVVGQHRSERVPHDHNSWIVRHRRRRWTKTVDCFADAEPDILNLGPYFVEFAGFVGRNIRGHIPHILDEKVPDHERL